VVELKTVERLAPIHVAQTLSYLKVTRLCLGLIINFNVTTLPRGIKRVIRTH
jgi:GxxExxY protein